ncbi:UDP-N-acetylmuramoyl-tripeptide--D-alanyl-D-alanine ligase [Candidatus Gottesmanbacteria bacterium]|nr:UDP-N-acetylmuramoyl-tripeptide--D-alanyl-D-alanine ligase [Candidatus Gottesmanbacteria bacterium]
MNIAITIVAFFWALRILRNILSYAQLWYVKEYRLDRMLIHLRTDQGKRIFNPSFRRPPISPKSVVLVGVTFIAFSVFVYSFSAPIFLSLLITDLLLFPCMGFFVFILNMPTFMYHSLLISLAVSKLRSHGKMVCIGITGSYGKTSTKEYLATILEQSDTVLKTAASKNSPIAIAELVLHNLKPSHRIFIVEMGAYKEGEIAQMCRMVLPEIGIVTAINEQHQDLFGNIETTMKAKYELISSLSGKKIAIMNADNPYVFAMAEQAKKDGVDVWCYTKDVKKKFSFGHVFYIRNIHESVDKLRFTILYKKKSYDVSAPVIGAFQAQNITAAIAGSIAGGMEIIDAVEACNSLQSVPKMMQKLDGIHGSIYINDTFNNNPDAACAALEYLRIGEERKILVFQPMIELGSFSQVAHERVGKLAGEVCDEILLTNTNFRTPFLQGVKLSGGNARVFVLDSNKAQKFLRNYLHAGDMVLFKGKEAQSVITLLEEKSL